MTAGNAGATSGTAGNINLTSGNAGPTGTSGDITLTGGNNTAAGGGNGGGAININGGNGTNGNYGGDITIYGGDATGGTGGNCYLGGGSGDGSGYAGAYAGLYGGAATNGADGGQLKLVGGRVSSGSGIAGTTILAGGPNTGAGAGGHVQIYGGYAHSTFQIGDVTIAPGWGDGIPGAINLHAAEYGTGQASVRFWDDTNAGHTIGNYVALKAPTFAGSPPANITYTLPELDGSAGDVMQTDGSGNLSFGPWVLPKFTVGTLPLVVEGGQIYVTDAVAGGGSPAPIGTQCFGRGVGSPLLTEWVDVTTGLAVV